MSSVARQHTNATGEMVTTYDPEQLKYQLYNIDSDNFSAFVKAHKDTQLIAGYIEENLLPGVGAALSKIISGLTENAMISISGKSSEKGRLLQMLLKDTHEEKIMYSGIPQEKKGGIAGFLQGAGNTNQEQQGGARPQGPPPKF